MKYLFILGRNPELSAAELRSYFKRMGINVLDFAVKGNSVLAEFDKSLDAGAIDFLGGVISIGIVICRVNEMDRKEVYMGEKNNFSYALWDFSSSTDDVREYLKKRFRKEKLKASEKKFREDLELQNSERGNKLSSKVDEEYFVYENYFGKIIEKCDYKKIEERDMKKPVRRESLSISPRLAKIMINLSEVKEGGVLLDSFCGIGVILAEALSQEIVVIGIDKDRKAIEGCRENMKWFKFPEENYRLINEDSSRTRINPFDVMVSEPDFGETLRKIPSKETAQKMIKNYENLMISVMDNVKKYVRNGRGRFVFTSPFIDVGKKRIGADFGRISSASGLKVVKGFPISEFRESQVVGREIIVLEK